MNEHFITDSAYRQRIQELEKQIADLMQQKTTAWINAMEHYDTFIEGEISKEEFRKVQDAANQVRDALIQATERKTAFSLMHFAVTAPSVVRNHGQHCRRRPAFPRWISCGHPARDRTCTA